VAVDVHQVLVLALLVDGGEVVPAGGEVELLGAQEGHGRVDRLLVPEVPPHNGGVQVGLVSALVGVVLPQVAQVRHLEPLVVVNGGPPAGGGPAKERGGDPPFVPPPLELAKVGLGEQITGRAVELDAPVRLDRVHEGVREHQAARGLPVLTGRPRNIREAIGGGGVKADNRRVRGEGVLGDQVDVLVRVAVVPVEDEPVRLDGEPALVPAAHVHLELRVVALVQEELAIRDGPLPTGLDLGGSVEQSARNGEVRTTGTFTKQARHPKLNAPYPLPACLAGAPKSDLPSAATASRPPAW
jgi:hypothetical protein